MVLEFNYSYFVFRWIALQKGGTLDVNLLMKLDQFETVKSIITTTKNTKFFKVAAILNLPVIDL